MKAAVGREGNYRFHFKALDPEFGTVKEEVRAGAGLNVCSRADSSLSRVQVFLDEAAVPGWEGKIVAWLEEDRGEDR